MSPHTSESYFLVSNNMNFLVRLRNKKIFNSLLSYLEIFETLELKELNLSDICLTFFSILNLALIQWDFTSLSLDIEYETSFIGLIVKTDFS